MRTTAMLAALLLPISAIAMAQSPALPPIQRPDNTVRDASYLPTKASQGALVVGRAPPGASVEYAGRTLKVSADGHFVFGLPRDAVGPLSVRIVRADGRALVHQLQVLPRDWPLERVVGVPPKTVNPPPAIAERIAREQAAVAAARDRDDDRTDYLQPFVWPVKGRISGRFGNARLYVATDGSTQAGSGHSGMDIAVPTGTPVKAPAAGIVTFAAPDLYLTGGTVLLDHGQGVSSNFLHLSRIDVKIGDRIEQGQVLGAVGATGRVTGPHLHWGMSWFDVRIDPLLVLDAGKP